MTCLAGCSNTSKKIEVTEFDVPVEVLEFKDPAVGKALASILDSTNLEEFSDADAFYIKYLETPSTVSVESEIDGAYSYTYNLTIDTYHCDYGEQQLDSSHGACKLAGKWCFATSATTVDHLFKKTGRTDKAKMWTTDEVCPCYESRIELNIDAENKITYRDFEIGIADFSI